MYQDVSWCVCFASLNTSQVVLCALQTPTKLITKNSDFMGVIDKRMFARDNGREELI